MKKKRIFEELKSKRSIKWRLKTLLTIGARSRWAFKSSQGVIDKIIFAFGDQYTKLNVLQTCIRLNKWDVSEKTIDDIYAVAIPKGLANKKDVRDFMAKAKKKFMNNCLKGKGTLEQQKFFEKYDGVLLDFNTNLKISCLLATQNFEGLGKPITKETADEHLLKTMKLFSVSLDDIIALGKHLPSGEDELNELKTKKLKLKVKRNRWFKSKAEIPKSEQKSEVNSTQGILTFAI